MKLGTLQETVSLRFDPSDAIKEPVHDSPNVGNTVAVTKKECVVSPGGGRIVPPRKIRDAKPYYPSALRGVWTEGTVQLEARIGLDGYVADVRIVGDAQPDLAQSAVASVREWRFTETLLNCTPVDVMMMVTVNFNAPAVADISVRRVRCLNVAHADPASSSRFCPEKSRTPVKQNRRRVAVGLHLTRAHGRPFSCHRSDHLGVPSGKIARRSDGHAVERHVRPRVFLHLGKQPDARRTRGRQGCAERRKGVLSLSGGAAGRHRRRFS